MSTKPRMVRAILIDPFACTVTEVEHDANDYRHIYALLSHESMPVDCFTAVHSEMLRDGEAIFVDDNGLLVPCDRFFVFAGFHQPLAGKGLILGSNKAGNTVAATSRLSIIQRCVIFAERIDDRLTATETRWVKPETGGDDAAAR